MTKSKIPILNIEAMAPVADGMKLMGLDPIELFSEFLPSADTSIESHVTANVIYRMLNSIANRLGRPTFGSELAVVMLERTIGFYDIDLEANTSLGDALTELIFLKRQNANAIAPLKLAISGEIAVLSADRTPELAESSIQVDCFTLTTIHELVRRKTGQRWTPRRVGIGISNPACLFHGPISKNNLSTMEPGQFFISFPTDWLIQLDSSVKGELSVWDSPSPVKTVENLYSALRPMVLTGKVSLEEAAEYCGMSARQLQFLLKREDISFSEVIDDIRREFAVNEIDRGLMSISDISNKLGYSDASAFNRAFKRWTGHSPSHYRAALAN